MEKRTNEKFEYSIFILDTGDRLRKDTSAVAREERTRVICIPFVEFIFLISFDRVYEETASKGRYSPRFPRRRERFVTERRIETVSFPYTVYALSFERAGVKGLKWFSLSVKTSGRELVDILAFRVGRYSRNPRGGRRVGR